MGAILLKNILLDGKSSDILIEDGLISKVGPASACPEWKVPENAEVENCDGKAAIPAFVNMHTHAAMSLMRGIGEEMTLKDWLAKIWAVEKKLDHEYIYWATKAACLEMIRTGTTTFNDQYWYFPDAHLAAVECGIRPALGYVILDMNDPSEAERQKEQCIRSLEFARKWNDNAIYEVAFHSVYSVSEEMILWISEFADKYDLNLHIHLSETEQEVQDCKKAHGGLTPVEYLWELGVLSDRLLAAHTLWLSEHDIELLADNGVHCIHNINSNAKIASGYRFPYNEMKQAGINICLGTDGCASSNNLDMLETMKTAALFQKAWRNDPAAMPLDQLMDMATVNGARALRFNGGRIEPGAVADIDIVDTEGVPFLSNGPFLANLVYSAHSDCIDSVISSGRFVMKHRQIPDEREIIQEARKVLSKIA